MTRKKRTKTNDTFPFSNRNALTLDRLPGQARWPETPGNSQGSKATLLSTCLIDCESRHPNASFQPPGSQIVGGLLFFGGSHIYPVIVAFCSSYNLLHSADRPD